ncbi:hypothetical protein ACFL20_08880 [Spirochaetota bacterium]
MIKKYFFLNVILISCIMNSGCNFIHERDNIWDSEGNVTADPCNNYQYTLDINFTYTGAPVEGGDVVRFAIFDANNHGADMCDSGNSWAFPTNIKCLQEFTIENNVTTVLQLRIPVPEFYMNTYLDKASITSSMGPGVIEEGYPYFVYNDLNISNGINATLIDVNSSEQQNLTITLDDTNIWAFDICSQIAE